jgi:hypothetical protein
MRPPLAALVLALGSLGCLGCSTSNTTIIYVNDGGPASDTKASDTPPTDTTPEDIGGPPPTGVISCILDGAIVTRIKCGGGVRTLDPFSDAGTYGRLTWTQFADAGTEVCDGNSDDPLVDYSYRHKFWTVTGTPCTYTEPSGPEHKGHME